MITTKFFLAVYICVKRRIGWCKNGQKNRQQNNIRPTTHSNFNIEMDKWIYALCVLLFHNASFCLTFFRQNKRLSMWCKNGVVKSQHRPIWPFTFIRVITVIDFIFSSFSLYLVLTLLCECPVFIYTIFTTWLQHSVLYLDPIKVNKIV